MAPAHLEKSMRGSVSGVFMTAAILSLACASGEQEQPEGTGPVTATPDAPPDQAPTPSVEGPLHLEFTALRDRGCPVNQRHSPVATRVLRNSPFAREGRRFSSQDLDALYRADGDWYQPEKELVVLDEADSGCVLALAAREEALRSMHCFDPESQAALTSDPEVLRWHLRTELDGLIGWETQSWSANDFDPCDASYEDVWDVDFQFAKWEVELGEPATANDAVSFVHRAHTPMTGPLEDEVAKRLERFTAWLEAGESLRCLHVSVSEQGGGPEVGGYEAMVKRACCGGGEFMAEDWVCVRHSLP